MSTRGVISSIKWNLSGGIAKQVLAIISVMILSRIIAPESFGIVATAAIFTGLASLLSSIGVKSVLVKIDDLTPSKIDILFTINLLVSATLFVLVNIASFFIARYFDLSQLVWVIQIMSITILLNAYNTVQIGILSKEMRFDILNKRTFMAQVISILFTVLIAVLGYDVLALSLQALLVVLFSIIILQKYKPYNPRLNFRFSSMSGEMKLGRVLFFRNILAYISSQLDNFLVGKHFGQTQLGYYQRAYSFVLLPAKMISGQISMVLNSMFAKSKDNLDKVSRVYLLTYRTVGILLLVILVPIIVQPKGFVLLFFGSNWLTMVPYVKVLAICGFLQGLNTLTIPVLEAFGLTKLIQVEMFLKSGLLIVGILIFVRYGIMALIYTRLSIDLFNVLVSIYQMKRALNLDVYAQGIIAIQSLGFFIIMIGLGEALNQWSHFSVVGDIGKFFTVFVVLTGTMFVLIKSIYPNFYTEMKGLLLKN